MNVNVTPNSKLIEAAIPHRPPMLLIDEIMMQSENQIVCRKTFSESDFFVQGHFPGFALVPGVILCECCLQSGSILLRQFTPQENVVPVATRLDGVKFKKMVRPGDTIQIDVKLIEIIATAFYMTGKIMLAGKVAVRLDFACSVARID